jgi:hypothetical protein
MTESDGSWVEEAMMVVLGVQRVHGAVTALDARVTAALMLHRQSQSRHPCQRRSLHCSQRHNQRRCPRFS